MNGTRGRQENSDGNRYTDVVIGSDTVTVSHSETRVVVFAGAGAKSLIVATIARKFDAALATRRYDTLFEKAPTP